MNMHADENSDGVIVPEKRPNKEGLPSAEAVEGRTPPKGNGDETAAARTLRRDNASNGLIAVRQAARQSKSVRFTALLHHITVDLHAGILRKQVSWVLDADIRGFFDAMAHSWIIRFLEHRIADKRILRLIAKWLKVGTVEDGRRTRGVCGAPQGAVISPILANVYLHYAFDLWVHRWRLTKASGDMIVIRYADDTIVGFQHEHEAQAFLDDLKERMRKFELALHPDKTRLIRFGRHAAKQREKRGEGKPETFDFLGFTHFCTRSRKWGSFVIGRKTIKKRMRAKLLAIKIELRRIMHDPIAKTGAWVKQMLKGHLNYFAVSGNHPSLWWFFNKVKRLWLASLKRRSQTARLSWERFIQCVACFFPPIRTLHPLPCHRFDAKTRGRSPVR